MTDSKKQLSFRVVIILVFILISQGCSPTNNTKEEINDCFSTILETPTLISAAMLTYRKSKGVWPNSASDINSLFDGEGEYLFDIDWTKLSGFIKLEELPDGSLEITSLDTEFPFTLKVGLPEDTQSTKIWKEISPPIQPGMNYEQAKDILVSAGLEDEKSVMWSILPPDNVDIITYFLGDNKYLLVFMSELTGKIESLWILEPSPLGKMYHKTYELESFPEE